MLEIALGFGAGMLFVLAVYTAVERKKYSSLKAAAERAGDEMRDALYKGRFKGGETRDMIYVSTRAALSLMSELSPGSEAAKEYKGAMSYLDSHWQEMIRPNSAVVKTSNALENARERNLPQERVNALQQRVGKMEIGIIKRAEAGYKSSLKNRPKKG
ncbi:MAG: hypothetical protein V1887_04510 [Candidatus Aenigmatarchaeota archaeon]